MTEQDPKPIRVTFTEYGYFDSQQALNTINAFKDAMWVAEREARVAYNKTPEGIAELEAARLAGIKEAKRIAKFEKRWQWLHDKLVAKGCECNHDWCGDY
jgi:phosphoglycerate-specific signal transduction histidine kinase